MWRAKRILAFALCLLLAASPAIAKDDYVTAELGDYRETGRLDGRLVYSAGVSLTFSEGRDARLHELFVKPGDQVKAGDPIASFTVYFDEAAYLEMERSLIRAREDAMSGMADYMARLAELAEKLDSTYNRAKKTELEYEIRILKAEFDRYMASAQEDIAQREADLAELAVGREPVVLTSTIDGVVSHVTTKDAGESISPQDVIAEIYDSESRVISVQDNRGVLRYGMEVEIVFADSRNSVSTTGRVIAAQDSLPDGVDSSTAYIGYVEPEGKYPTLYVHIAYVTVSAEDVLVIPYSAVSMENGLYFVYILAPDGTRQKRYVNLAGHADGVAWVLQGLKEGDTVID